MHARHDFLKMVLVVDGAMRKCIEPFSFKLLGSFRQLVRSLPSDLADFLFTKRGGN